MSSFPILKECLAGPEIKGRCSLVAEEINPKWQVGCKSPSKEFEILHSY